MAKVIALNAESLVSPIGMKGYQVRAAREMLGISQIELCEACSISRPTLRDIERGTGDPKRSSLDLVEAFLRGKGIKFVNDVGAIGISPNVDEK